MVIATKGAMSAVPVWASPNLQMTGISMPRIKPHPPDDTRPIWDCMIYIAHFGPHRGVEARNRAGADVALLRSAMIEIQTARVVPKKPHGVCQLTVLVNEVPDAGEIISRRRGEAPCYAK
jgi:hypothetical protein